MTSTSPCIVLREGNRKHQFGFGLENDELQWILQEVNQTISKTTNMSLIDLGLDNIQQFGTSHQQF